MVFIKGQSHTAWNKGLTKETDSRVARVANAKTGKKQPNIAKAKLGRLNHKTSETLKRGYALGIIKPARLGIPVSEEMKKRIAISESKTKIQNRVKEPLKILGHMFKGKGRRIANWNAKTRFTKGHKHSEVVLEKLRIFRATQVFPLKDSSIEIKLQSQLARLNIPYEKHVPLVRQHQVDILIRPNIVIETYGCYWHSCSTHCRNNKYASRILKDKEINDKLTNDNYVVIVLWEHEINKSDFDISRYLKY